MSGELPKVNPEVLLTATASFGEAVDALNRMHADAPVGDAAASAGQLLTAESCRRAQAGITAAVTAAVDSVRSYSESLDAAVHAYAVMDQSAADDIGDVDIPS
jgi:Excreted virulence factor EspC, type VII ESX diderm